MAEEKKKTKEDKSDEKTGCLTVIILAVIIAVVVGGCHACSNSNSSSNSEPKTHKVTKKLEMSSVNIDNQDEDYVTYHFKSFKRYKTNAKDNWSVAPATVNKVEVAMLKKTKYLKVEGLMGSNPLPKKEKIKGFIFVTINIPKAYSADLTVGIDGGAATFPKYDDILISGLIIPGQTGDKLYDKYDKCYDIEGQDSFTKTTKKGTLNVQKMLVAVPIPVSVKKYQPLKIRFNAHTKEKQDHLYQLNIKW